jgi:signal peptidase II
MDMLLEASQKNIKDAPIKKMIVLFVTIIFLVALDRLLKILAIYNPERPISLIGQILKFDFTPNYQIAFSLPLAGWPLIIIITLIIVILIFTSLYYFKRRDYIRLNLLMVVILGAGSNLFDRFRYGSVIDYLDLKYFTVFNLADAMIVIGVVGLIFYNYKLETKK